jgi:hypothetical protein
MRRTAAHASTKSTVIIRAFLLITAVSVTAMAQATPARPVRFTTSYVFLGRPAIDTAAVSNAFRRGLLAESLVRILPPLTDSAAHRPGQRVESAAGWISLDVFVAVSTARLRASWIAMSGTSRIVLDSVSALPPDSLLGRAHVLGRRAAQRIQSSGSRQ